MSSSCACGRSSTRFMTGKARVALVTYRGLPNLNADDRLAAAALQRLGLRTEAVCWDDPTVDWLTYAAVVLRSTWDYHLRAAEFQAWLARMEALDAHLWNRPRILRWNTDKRYLTRLSHPHLNPPPTVILERGSTVDFGALPNTYGWDQAVMKPAISADGFLTERTSRAQAASSQALLDAMLASADVVIQRFVPEICVNGRDLANVLWRRVQSRGYQAPEGW